jgi:predicted O-methyltransferase YrrM
MWGNRLHETKAWFRHMVKAKGPHGVHSPFVYDLITKVLRNKKRSSLYAAIERERSRLKSCKDELDVIDYGAGSRVHTGSRRSVQSIARTALQPASHARALTMIAGQSQRILELGTSLGITTAHFAAALPQATIYTIEGSEAIAEQAQHVWRRLNLKTIESVVGDFDAVLHSVLTRMQQVDCLIIDGNHSGDACLRYLEMALPFCNEGTVFIIDDIYWSPSMTDAWMRLVEDERFTLSLDFFDFGVLYCTRGRVKEHFVLKRPWVW